MNDLPEDFPDLRATHHGRELRPLTADGKMLVGGEQKVTFQPSKIPMQQAIEQVAAQLNMPVDEVAVLARRMQAGKLQIGTPMTNGRSAFSVGLGTALAIAAQHERNRALLRHKVELTDEFQGRIQQLLASVSYASERIQRLHGVRPVFGPGKCPANPKDRRTVRIAGKPKHYVQHGDELVLKDGESPWT